jgi:AcrR family transcriptional regulator
MSRRARGGRALYIHLRRMTRPKTISDEELLAVARRLFRAQGHAVSTRQVAEAAGISEAILYQRFGNKDELFFAAMAPGAPDVEEVLGPEAPDVSAREYLRTVVGRMADYFGEVLPLAVRLITHPSFDHKSLGRAQAAPEKLRQGLIARLQRFESRGELRRSVAEPLAQMLVNLAHDWALSAVMSGKSSSRRVAERDAEIAAMVDVVWKGAAPLRRPS